VLETNQAKYTDQGNKNKCLDTHSVLAVNKSGSRKYVRVPSRMVDKSSLIAHRMSVDQVFVFCPMLDYIEQIHRGLIGILFVEKLFTEITDY